jgi:glucose/arabinose dehydrogenase/chitodextrinase
MNYRTLSLFFCGLTAAVFGSYVTVHAAPILPPGFTDTVVLSGLTQPTAVRFSPDGRMFVAEKSGLIKVFSSLSNPTPSIFADLRSNVYDYWDRGLLSIALHPNFPSTPYIYALYTLDAPIGGSAPTYNDACPDPTGVGCLAGARLSKLKVSGNAIVLPEEVLIEDWCQQFPSHSIGNIAFGGDGALYVSGGEGASFTFTDYGQQGNPCKDPPQEGGSLRSQDKESNAAAGSDIVIYAAGTPGGGYYPDMELQINGQTVRWFSSVQGDPYNRKFIEYHYVSPTPVAINQIKVAYTNDWQVGTTDKDLRVDKIVLDGVVYETEASSTYSTGTYVAGSDCVVPGYKNSEWLHCNGSFAYGNNLSPVPPAASQGDTVGYNGTILRIDPITGSALPDNPYIGGRVDDDRIIAYGMRNPFRFAIPPGMSDVWVGDVGAGTWEEINRIPNAIDSVVENFGWPCYEGAQKNADYASANTPLCQALYAKNTVTAPFYQYNHNGGTASITGLAFYPGGSYPAQYNGALFFTDYSQGWLKVMLTGGDSRPNPALVQTIIDTGLTAVDVQAGPNGDIFYVDNVNGTVHRLTYVAGNTPPVAKITSDKTSGPLPLTVSFDGSTSSDPDHDALTFAWDLNGDGVFDDSTVQKPQYTYATKNKYTVGLRVTDARGASTTASLVIDAGNNPPVVTIASPAASLTYKVGDVIAFSGSASDPDSGAVPVQNLTWKIVQLHCAPTNPSDCHEHVLQSMSGISSGSITAPDHEYPSSLEFRLTATSDGQATTLVRKINPKTVALTFNTNPSNMQLAVGSVSQTAPFTRTMIMNSKFTVSATTPQTRSGIQYTFLRWSDAGAATHIVTAPTSNATYTAFFKR